MRGLRGPVQIAYAVDDVVAAAEAWVERGAGPFYVREHIEVTNSRMHGVASVFDHSSAYGQYGDVMVELLCEHHTDTDRVGPSLGVHHLAFFVDEVSTAQLELSALGWSEVLYAEAGGTPFAMHDARAELGHLIEIYHEGPRLRGFYELVRSSALDWDGSEPVRMITG